MPRKVVIIGDGRFPKTEYPRYLIRTADFIICCDGALQKFLRNSVSIFGEERLPDLVIGDMDTLSASYRKKYADIIVTVDEQDHASLTERSGGGIGTLCVSYLRKWIVPPSFYKTFCKRFGTERQTRNFYAVYLLFYS